MSEGQINHKDSHMLLTSQEIFDFMCQYDRQMRSDCDFDQTVEIKHQDKSEFLLKHASLKEDVMRIYVYTEHCGFFWFSKHDLVEMRIKTWERDKNNNTWQISLDEITIFDGE